MAGEMKYPKWQYSFMHNRLTEMVQRKFRKSKSPRLCGQETYRNY